MISYSSINEQDNSGSSLQQSRKRPSPAMVSEYSILIQVASALGTYRLNRNTAAPENVSKKPKIAVPSTRTRTASVHQEAELLLNFMATSPDESLDTILLRKPLSTVKQLKTPERRSSIMSPSFSFESKRIDHHDQDCEKVNTKQLQVVENQQCHISSGSTYFDVNCPSLSLSLNNDSDGSVNDPTDSSPSHLFSRPIISDPVNMDSMDMNTVADTIGSNLIQSFSTAMIWRTKTWIKALSQKLSVRYEAERNRAVRDAVHHRSFNDTVDAIKDAIKNSHEARVIHSLSKAASTVVVHDVRTTFFILEQQLNDQEDENGMPPPKRRRQVSSESMERNETGESYDLSHAITLDAKCSVSTSTMKKTTVSFRAPGVIHGTFVRDRDGNVSLTNVSISLDTEALALSMEENSRRIVRAASEEWMISPPINYCTIYDTVQSQNVSCDASDSTPVPKPEEALDSQRYYSDRRYESYFYSPTAEPNSPGALVTPKVEDSSSEGANSMASHMPPSLRSLPLEDERHCFAGGRFLNPRRVSPTEHPHQQAPFVTPTPVKVPLMDTRIIASNLPVPPSLVSPYITNGEQVAEDADAPSMPALLEVARAAHAKCH